MFRLAPPTLRPHPGSLPKSSLRWMQGRRFSIIPFTRGRPIVWLPCCVCVSALISRLPSYPWGLVVQAVHWFRPWSASVVWEWDLVNHHSPAPPKRGLLDSQHAVETPLPALPKAATAPPAQMSAQGCCLESSSLDSAGSSTSLAHSQNIENCPVHWA